MFSSRSRRFYRFLTGLLVVSATTIGTVCAGTLIEEDEALRLAFPAASDFVTKRAVATGDAYEQLKERLGGRDNISRIMTYQEARDAAGSLLGYAIVGDTPGKHQPITYMAAFTTAPAVKHIEILVYREAYGDEIRRDSFKEQFYGKGPDATLSLGDDIRNIAGATISCRSMVHAVRDDLIKLDELVVKKGVSSTSLEQDDSIHAHTEHTTSQEPQLYSRTRYLMGTALRIDAYAAERSHAYEAMEAAFAEVARIEALISSWQPDSEISRLNKQHGVPVALSEETLALLRRSQAYHAASGGVLDLTVAPLVQQWRDAASQERLPEPEAVDAVRSHVGMEHLELGGGVATLHRGRLELGAVGKGYALDRAAAVLREQGLPVALLNFGGQLLALDAPTGREGWEVYVSFERSLAPDAPYVLLTLENRSIATTGDSERGYVIDGVRYSHVIDPRNGMPVNAGHGVSVLADSAEFADAMSTALYVLKEEAGGKLASQSGVESIWWLAAQDDGSGLPHVSSR